MQLFLIVISLTLSYCVNAQSWTIDDLKTKSESGQTVISVSTLYQQDILLENVVYQCPGHMILFPQHRCQDGSLSVQSFGHQWLLDVNGEINWSTNRWMFEGVLWDSSLHISVNSDSNQWPLQLNRLSWQQLQPILQIPQLDNLTAFISGVVNWQLNEGILISEEVKVDQVSHFFSDEMIVDSLSGNLAFSIDINHLAMEWQLQLEAGEALIGPVYLNFSEWPLLVTGQWSLDGVDGWNLVLTISDNISTSLNAEVNISEKGNLRYGTLQWLVDDATVLNKRILGSVLDLYGFKSSQIAGAWSLNMRLDNQQLTNATWELKDLSFDNDLRKLSADSLNGKVYWQHDSHQKASALTWDNLLVAGMPVGQSSVDFLWQYDQIDILGQPEWPVFDGSLIIEEWSVSRLFSDALSMHLSAEVKPISLSLVTEKMGWPKMRGSISGHIPSIIKNGAVVVFEGGLDLEVFEGTMRVNQLSTERLFGVAPVIAADVRFADLNLGQLTETFDFGKITGLLSGTIEDLRITNWKTDRLKAEIYTVKKKGVKQTISQQAIDHISSLGGIQGAISRSFLRFFDEFKYQKIKLSCVLHNSVCQVGGIHNSNRQFTIVEGGGIPKINIVGFVREIDWEIFISRLLNANYE